MGVFLAEFAGKFSYVKYGVKHPSFQQLALRNLILYFGEIKIRLNIEASYLLP